MKIHVFEVLNFDSCVEIGRDSSSDSVRNEHDNDPSLERNEASSASMVDTTSLASNGAPGTPDYWLIVIGCQVISCEL